MIFEQTTSKQSYRGIVETIIIRSRAAGN